MENTAEEVAMQIIALVANSIRDAGEQGLPSGHLYAILMGHVTINSYQAIIASLKRIGYVKESNHLLTWIGPAKEVKDGNQ